MATPRKVTVLAGGRSSEREVSLASGEAVRQGLLELGHQVTAVEITADGHWYEVPKYATEEGAPSPPGDPLALRPGLGEFEADVVFPVLHGPYGEDGSIQGFLETIGVPYVGSGVAASAVCLDKLLFKEVAGRAGIPQVEYVAIEDDAWSSDERSRDRLLEQARDLGLPCFVKPARLGSSVGITRVAEAGELEPAIQNALRYDPRVIVEAAALGDEIECSVIGNRELDVSQPGKLEFAGDWYDFAAKYEAGGMRLLAPAPIDESLEIEICALAVRAFRVAGCAGMARVDFFVDGSEILVNEINTIPGFTPTSVFAKLFEASGMRYGELLNRLLDLAIERFEREREFRF